MTEHDLNSLTEEEATKLLIATINYLPDSCVLTVIKDYLRDRGLRVKGWPNSRIVPK